MAPPALVAQSSLFGSGPVEVDEQFSGLQRHVLTKGAWVDHLPGWVRGHQQLFDYLVDNIEWSRQCRPMYDRVVEVPRLLGSMPDRSARAGVQEPTAIDRMAEVLSGRYRTEFERIGIALYRDGRDSVAFHGDMVAREMTEALVATVSVGEPRKFRLRPKGGGPGLAFNLGHGDLVVMGGSCQRTWEHGVPKVARAGPRIAIMFRPRWPDQ